VVAILSFPAAGIAGDSREEGPPGRRHWSVWTGFMAKKKSKREYVWLECMACGHRNYRTSISVAEGTPKLQLKKFCKSERKHTVHKLRRK
jgi:large subunit ribosomal protein L33